MILGLCAGAAAIAFFGAEALRFELSSASQRADLQKLEDEIAAATGNAKWEQEEATLAQLADEASRSNPLAIAAIALDHVRTLDLVSKGFSVSTDRLRLEVEVPSGSELSELARRLEDEPLLVRVRPQLDSAKQHAVLFADICYLQPESRCHPVAIASNKASSTKLESYAGQSDAPPLTARAVP